jgi:Tfp pilus assembly protein PilX
MTRHPRRQRGATLVVSLIMLVLITLMAISSFTLGKSNLQIVGNMQQRQQAFAAAQDAVATVISTIQFTLTPTNAVPVPCAGANTVCVDANGDGVADETVTVTVVCDSIQPIPVTALNWNILADQNCLQQAGQNTGQPGATNNNSLCSNSVWDVQASATDTVSGANSVIDQGVGVRVWWTTVCP